MYLTEPRPLGSGAFIFTHQNLSKKAPLPNGRGSVAQMS